MAIKEGLREMRLSFNLGFKESVGLVFLCELSSVCMITQVYIKISLISN